MTLRRLLLRNLFYYWRGNSAVLLGVAVGAAVLTGALLVGDSLRGSLKDLTLQRLGWVDQALVSGRFIHEGLAAKLPAERISPIILLQGAASSLPDSSQIGAAEEPSHRASQVAILGVDSLFWPAGQAPGAEDFWQSAADEVMLNAALARELAVSPGQTVTLNLQKVSAIPRETLLGRRDAADVLDEMTVKVHAILPDQGLARFSLNPSPVPARNAFVPLRRLQAKLGVKRRVNALLVGNPAEPLQRELARYLTLDDWGLVLREPKSQTGDSRRYVSLESRQLLIEASVAEAALAAAQETGLKAAPTLVYLANSISNGQRSIPYSVVAALDPTLPPPLGPFLPAGVHRLQDDEIVLVDWKESPLQARPGDPITLTFFPPEEQGQFHEQHFTFRLKGKISLRGAADDPNLAPDFPGITDKLSISDWDPPFPYDNKRVKKQDEDYWKKYRTTPKAYVTLAAGKRLWKSRFGELTSIRLAGRDGVSLRKALEDFRRRLLAHLHPEQSGLTFNPVRARGLEASAGSSDFRWLFLLFSIFLIAAGLLLVGLLFRLNLDRRAAEVGLLLAAGYRRRTVRRLLLAEGGLLALAGGLLGCLGAVLYARLMLDFLGFWWPGGLDSSLLHFHGTWTSFVVGYVAALAISILTILWAMRVLGRVPPRALLVGETTLDEGLGSRQHQPRWSLWFFGLGIAGALGCVAAGMFAQDSEMKALSFFGSGTLLLAAGLAVVWAWMSRSRHGQVTGRGLMPVARLGVRNASRHRVRSLLTAGLLAAATFVVVAVQSFHRAPGQDFLDRHSGSGGFVLLGESDVPIYQDLNSAKGRDELNFSDRDQSLLQGVTFYSFRVRAGDDASCLNLYQPTQPRLLGVPHDLIERDGFRFQGIEAGSPEDHANPWRLLEKEPADGAVPVFGDANTIEWILKSKLGGELAVANEQGRPVRLRIVGLLQDSIFQNGLLLSEANFLKLYPSHQGYNFFLVGIQPPASVKEVRNILLNLLARRGLAVTSTADRLAEYLGVENTYLWTFQALGGLGLLLGALGLGVVFMRSIWERRGELALLRAFGFSYTALGWLVLAENGFLLVLGLGVGTVAALVAVAPHLASGAGEVLWLRLGALLGLVLAVGLAAGTAAMISALRTPLLPALRRE